MTLTPPIWPEAFEERIKKQFPQAAGSFLESLSLDACTGIRVNPSKFQVETKNERVAWCTGGYFLEERPLFALDPLWHAGAYYVQEASSMFLEQVFRQTGTGHPRLVLDLCAAPGGKSTHLASLIGPNDLLVANEVISTRVPVLIENLTKWGYPNVLVSSSDPKQFGNAGAFADVLVVDAPCSGEGLFRRDPEAAKEWSTENTALCAMRQRRILAGSLGCLKTGGYLIYSTCTFNPAENEENLDWLRSQDSYVSVRVPLDPEWQVEELEYRGIYGYRFLPHKVSGEGFFIALLQKQEESPAFRFPSKFRNRLQKPAILPVNQLRHPASMKFFQHHDQLKFIPSLWEKEILYLLETIHVVKAGTTAGQLMRNELLPDHELAMSVELKPEAFSIRDLPAEEALKYLAREPFGQGQNGETWQLVSFRGTPLGFVKNIGNRFNNYYPKAWRLRMQPALTGKFWYEKS